MVVLFFMRIVKAVNYSYEIGRADENQYDFKMFLPLKSFVVWLKGYSYFW